MLLENSGHNHRGKTPSMRGRRCILLLVLIITATITTFFYTRNLLAGWPQPPWFEEPLHNTSTPPGSYFVEYPHRYDFLLDEVNRCREESPFLVLMVPVEPDNMEARDIIRNTWGRESTVLGRVVRHYFLLGVSGGPGGAVDERVLAESERHHDILQSDFQDSYNNLTIKTMVMFEWLSSHCPNTSYAMKIDSDIFLNVHNLVAMLLKAPTQLYITGLVTRGAPVLRDPNSKWFLPFSVFPETTYPPYLLGLGYVFSLDLPKKIREASANVKAIYIEDVYVGLCMRDLGIEVTDPPSSGLFQAWKPLFTGSCHWVSVITTMMENSKQLSAVWGMYENELQSGCS